MTQVSDVMTTNLCVLSMDAPVSEAAEMMRDRDVGDVLVLDAEGDLHGIATDRDVTIRAVAEGLDPTDLEVAAVCSPGPLTVLAPDDEVSEAVEAIRSSAVKRLPVVDNGKPVGIVSLGDLAIERDPESALGEISAGPANN